MVRIKDDYIEWIEPYELEDLKWNEELEINLKRSMISYKVGPRDRLTIGEEDMQFLHIGHVVDVDYDDIECMYKIKKPWPSDYGLVFYFLGFMFLILGLVLIALGV